MSGPRDDRIAAQQRWGGAGHGARMPLARRLQAPMRPRFFPRDVYGPAADPPGPDRLGWMVQVGRPQGRWLTTRVGIAHATPAAPHGWLAGVRPHGALGRHCYHAGSGAIPPLHGQRAPPRVRVGQHGLQGRAPGALQPGSPELPRCTYRGRLIAGGLETPPRAQTGAGPRADLLAPLPDGITAVRHNDQGASRPPASHPRDDWPGALGQGLMTAALRRIEARRGTQDRQQGQRPDAPGPWPRGQQHPTAPAPAPHLDHMRVGGAHRLTLETSRAQVSAASARNRVIKTTDDAPRHAPGHSPSQQEPTGCPGQPDGSIQDAMIALNVGLCAEPPHTERCSHGPPSRGEDGAREENVDMRPNRLRKHRGQDRHDTDQRGRQREHRDPCVIEE
jgi:hypothetical protein